MKHLNVLIPPMVQEQIRSQVFYIARDSIDNALAWEDRLLAAISALGSTPGYTIDEEASRRLGEIIHKYVFEKTYLIHYRIEDERGTLDIVNFRHGARLPRMGEP